MKRFLIFSCIFLAVSSACLSTATPTIIHATSIPSMEDTPMPATIAPEPINKAITLQRGMNMGNMLEAPNEGEWGLHVREAYFDEIKNAGFDFVRLPIRWSAHAADSAPYLIDASFFARVDQIIAWALDRDLVIIVDLHHYEEMMTDPRGNQERLLGLWEQIAEHYKDYPSTVLFEILNEPNSQLDAALWNEI